MKRKAVINMKNITKIYTEKGEELYANKNINLEIYQNDRIGIVGSNGAGKTTLIKIIAGLLSATSGSIKYSNNDTPTNLISVVLEGTRNLYDFLTIEDNIYYFGRLNNILDDDLIIKSKELLEYFNLYDRKNSIVNTLSRGMKQKLAIIIALVKTPKILILDEPTLGLDFSSKLDLIKLIKKMEQDMNMTFIICSHDLDFIKETVETICVIDKGKIIRYDLLKNFEIQSEDLYEFTYITDDNKIKVVKSKNINDLKKNNSKIQKIEKIPYDLKEFLKELYINE